MIFTYVVHCATSFSGSSLESWQITCSKNEFSRTKSDFQYAKYQEIDAYFFDINLTISCFLTKRHLLLFWPGILVWPRSEVGDQSWSRFAIELLLLKGANFCWSRKVFEAKSDWKFFQHHSCEEYMESCGPLGPPWPAPLALGGSLGPWGRFRLLKTDPSQYLALWSSLGPQGLS